jgi:hypothetical protein
LLFITFAPTIALNGVAVDKYGRQKRKRRISDKSDSRELKLIRARFKWSLFEIYSESRPYIAGGECTYGSFVPPRLVGAIIGGQSERNVREHPSVNIWGTASEMCVCERESCSACSIRRLASDAASGNRPNASFILRFLLTHSRSHLTFLSLVILTHGAVTERKKVVLYAFVYLHAAFSGILMRGDHCSFWLVASAAFLPATACYFCVQL